MHIGFRFSSVSTVSNLNNLHDLWPSSLQGHQLLMVAYWSIGHALNLLFSGCHFCYYSMNWILIYVGEGSMQKYKFEFEFFETNMKYCKVIERT